jgi:hypothetical protein
VGIVFFCCDLNPEDIRSDGVLLTLTPSRDQPEDL